MSAVLVTGATGLVGQQLLAQLPSARVLSRNPARAEALLPGSTAYKWLPQDGPPPVAALDGVRTVYHLAGESVAGGRWNDKRKKALVSSRVTATRNLVEGLKHMVTKPQVLVVASAVGVYGDRGDTWLNESSEPGDGFLAELCCNWEKEAMRAESFGVRVVCLRLGLVLSKEGGALARMLPPFKWGLGGPLGSGRQWMSWIHVDDVVGLFLHAAQSAELSGPVNGVSPHPASNRDFSRALGKALHRPVLFRVPQLALTVALGELSSVLLSSQRVEPKRALHSGYRFLFPDLAGALAQAI